MTRYQAGKDYDKLSKAFNSWLKASLSLSQCVYTQPLLNEMLRRDRPYNKIHDDALCVMALLRERLDK